MDKSEVIEVKEWKPDALDTELGFKNPREMSLEEKIDECLMLQREWAKSVITLSRNPMFSAMGIQLPGRR